MGILICEAGSVKFSDPGSGLAVEASILFGEGLGGVPWARLGLGIPCAYFLTGTVGERQV